MISLLTPTGGRPEAFALCEQWIARQTYDGEFEWVVVDDCDPPTPTTMGQRVVRPSWRWAPGDDTQRACLHGGLDVCDGWAIAIIEDDDWYHPRYLETMVKALTYRDRALAGEGEARYYNLRRRTWRQLGNRAHASLCSTILRTEVLRERLWRICSSDSRPRMVDIALWQTDDIEKAVLPGRGLVVGIKGMPGRPGIGIGHRDDMAMTRDDAVLSQLYQWVGDDVDAYRQYVSCRT